MTKGTRKKKHATPVSERYFFTQSASEVKYGSAPSNVLSVTRLLSNKPCWRADSESTIPKQKTLIINVNESLLDINSTQVARKRLDALKNHGFNSYVLKEGFFRSLSNLEFSSISNESIERTQTRSYEDEELHIEAVRQLHVPYDEIFILNQQELNLLIKGDDNDWIHLPSFQNVDLTDSNISGESLARLLSAKGHEIEILNLTDCINLQDTSFDEPLVLPKLRALLIGSSNFSGIPTMPSEAVEKLIKASVLTLEALELNTNDDNRELDPFLQHFSQPNRLKSFILSGNLEVTQHTLNRLDFS